MSRTHGRMRKVALGSLPVLTFALLGSACANSPQPTTPAPPTSAAGSTNKWTKLAGPCPTLTGKAATALHTTGAGRPSAADTDTPVAQNINCTWGDSKGSVGVSIYLNRNDRPSSTDSTTASEFQRTFDGYVADGSILYWKPEPGLEDKAYLGIHKDRATIELWVLSGNARITVYHQVAELEKPAWHDALALHRDTLRGLAADVLDDLS